MNYVIEMLDIWKEFPGIIANGGITLQVEEGEIHAILGENGAGKSTLMSILFGLYHADKHQADPSFILPTVEYIKSQP